MSKPRAKGPLLPADGRLHGITVATATKTAFVARLAPRGALQIGNTASKKSNA